VSFASRASWPGAFNDKGGGAYGNAFFLHPDPGHGNHLAVHGDDVGQFLDVGDIPGEEFVIKGIFTVRVDDQTDFLRVGRVFLGGAGKGDVSVAQPFFIAGALVHLDLKANYRLGKVGEGHG